jgi:hypothetical protein
MDDELPRVLNEEALTVADAARIGGSHRTCSRFTH